MVLHDESQLELGCLAAWSLPTSVWRGMVMAGCYQHSEVRAGSMQGSSGEGSHSVLVHPAQVALGLSFQHGSGLGKERSGQGAPSLLGRKACFCPSLGCQPASGQLLMSAQEGLIQAMSPACRSGATVVRACTCRAASVGLRHLITPCRLDSGEQE